MANNERWDKILYNVLKNNNLTLYVQKHKFSIGINTRNRHLYTFKEAIERRKLDNLKNKKQLALNKIRKSLRTQSINDFLKERENIKSARQQKQENIRLAKVEGKHNCSYIRDKLLQHEENRKWYNLDSNGQRRYLSEEEVKRNHMKYIDLENKLCK